MVECVCSLQLSQAGQFLAPDSVKQILQLHGHALFRKQFRNLKCSYLSMALGDITPHP